MPSWPSKLIFPVDGSVAEISMGDEFFTQITESVSSEKRNSLWDTSRMVIDISGMKFTTEQRRLVRAFNRIVKGRAGLFWFRRGNDDEFEMQNELIGIGDGTNRVFQCRLYDEMQNGKSGEYIITALDHDIPDVGLDANGNTTRPTSYITVTVNGVVRTLGTHYAVSRETGVITFTIGNAPANGAEVRVSGGFYVPVRMNQEGIKLSPLGSGFWIANQGTEFYQPKGGK